MLVEDINSRLFSELDFAYGPETSRAVENFQISRYKLFHVPELVRSLAMVKLAAARVNESLGLLEVEKAKVIISVCEEIISGYHHEHFVVDVIQGGAGTSTNMNANEVIANLGLLKLGYNFGDFDKLHPNDDVNRSQSTNDVYPTSIRLALLQKTNAFLDECFKLCEALDKKSSEFSHVLKVGRTQLQDAVPMTLGEEFSAFSSSIVCGKNGVIRASEQLKEINIGGTAVGSGILASHGYRERIIAELSDVFGCELRMAENLFRASYDQSALVGFSSALKVFAISLSKIASDLRLLSSGPRAGIGEIFLPTVQAGSSIMPGKVNPVIPEMVNQVCYSVIGNDLTVSLAAEAGELQLNAMEPVIVYKIFESLNFLENALKTLRVRCIDDVQSDIERCKYLLENSLVFSTKLVNFVGYDRASELTHIARKEGVGLMEVIRRDEKLAGLSSIVTGI